jgi:hypothetical protein
MKPSEDSQQHAPAKRPARRPKSALTERVAALDIGEAALTACIRVPDEDKPGARRQEVRTPPGSQSLRGGIGSSW